MQGELEKYREILSRKVEEARRGISARNVAKAMARDNCPADEGDLSQQSHEEWLFIQRNMLESNRLRELMDALRRIKEGVYGVCLSCEEPISRKRLDALPWARFCVSCQERVTQDPEAETRDRQTPALR